MLDHRHLKEAWNKTQTDWNTNRNKTKVNTGCTKREILEEGQTVDIPAHENKGPAAHKAAGKKAEVQKQKPLPKVKEGKKLSPEQKAEMDVDNDNDIDAKDLKMLRKGKEKKVKEDTAAGAVAGATTAGEPAEANDDGGYDSDEQNQIARWAGRIGKGVQTRHGNAAKEGLKRTLESAYKKFVVGESVLGMEEEDEDMGADDDIGDVDEPEMGYDDEEAEMPEFEPEMPEMEPEVEPSVPGMGQDPIEARLAAIEARLAALETGEAGEEIGDLGDEMPADLAGLAPEEPEFDMEPAMDGEEEFEDEEETL